MEDDEAEGEERDRDCLLLARSCTEGIGGRGREGGGTALGRGLTFGGWSCDCDWLTDCSKSSRGMAAREAEGEGMGEDEPS